MANAAIEMARSRGLGDTMIRFQHSCLIGLQNLAERLGTGRRLPTHLKTGLRGEFEALFDLRRRGYTIVARRWASAKARGDIDLIAWDRGWLCFIEVKTRTARDMTPAQSAVDEDKRETLRRLARIYLHSFPESERRTIPVRFDVISVYCLDGRYEFDLFQGAFGRS
jgi:putative endonuclease